MDILLIDEKIKNNLIFNTNEKIKELEEIEELEKVLEYLTFKNNILKCEKKLVEKRELQEKCMEELQFYFLETSHIIDKYEKILSKPILHSEENKREKSDIIKEYLEIVNSRYKKAFYQSKSNKIDIIKEYLEIAVKPLPPPPSHKIETLKELEEIVKKLKKASKTKTKKILISHENEDNFIHKYFEKDNYSSIINIEKILYYEPEPNSNKMRCNNCNGINLILTKDFISCVECGCVTTRILNLYSSSDIGRVNPRRIYKSMKKKSESLEVLRLVNICRLAEEESYKTL